MSWGVRLPKGCVIGPRGLPVPCNADWFALTASSRLHRWANEVLAAEYEAEEPDGPHFYA